MAVNLASKYSKNVSERFKLKSLTNSGGNHDYEWSGVKTVTVYSVDTATMNDYSRTGSDRYGTASELGTTKQDLTLSKDRSFTFTIDRGNHQESMMVTEAGKSLARQIDEKIIPEIDTYRLATWVTSATANSGVATAAVTATNAYQVFLAGNEYLDDNKVPTTGRIAYVTPSYYNFLKRDNEFVKASDMGQKIAINGLVGEVDGVMIVKVPTSYFPANTAFVMLHPSATCFADKLEDYKTHDNPPGINGWLVEGRTIYDAFVLDSKKKAIYAHKTAI